MTWRNTPPKGRKLALCLVVPIRDYMVLQWDPVLRRWCDDEARISEDSVIWTPLRRPPQPESQWGGITDKTHELGPTT